MSTMKYVIVLVLAVCSAFANTREIQMQSATDAICLIISDFFLKHPTSELTNWGQLEEFDFALKGLNAYFPDSSIGEQFSFVSPHNRKKYPDGELILVQTNFMEWPAEWKAKDPTVPGKELEGKRYEPIRFIIYKANGRVMSAWVTERLFKKVILDSEITLEPAKNSLTFTNRVPSVKYSGLSGHVAPPPPEPTPEPVKSSVAASIPMPTAEPTPAAKSNPVWWIVGSIILAVGVVFVTRKKKSSA
jgi:hypothetical protein